MRMKIALVTPARPVAHSGNRNTAVRWAQMLRELGHRVSVLTRWDGKSADLKKTQDAVQEIAGDRASVKTIEEQKKSTDDAISGIQISFSLL